MKTILLRALTLTNYRNIEFEHLEFDGNSKIVGENRIGKTNTLESIIYLLTDKLLNGNSDVSAIKPLKDTKREVTVEAEFDVDGKSVVLKKTYGENWVKRRNTAELYLDGHFCNYYYNGIKQGTIKAFNKLLCEDFGLPTEEYEIDIRRLLLDPLYLGELGDSKDWTKLRAFIIDLVGNVSDDEVFEKDTKLMVIKADLENCGGRADQLKKLYKSNCDELISTIEGQKAQVELLEKTECPTEDAVLIAERGLEEISDRIQKLKTSGETIDTTYIDTDINLLTSKLNKLKEDILSGSARNENRTKEEELKNKRMSLFASVQKHFNYKSEMASERNIKQNKLSLVQSDIKHRLETRAELITQIKELDNQLKNLSVSTVCPTCGQKLPESMVEEQYNKAKADLNTKRAALMQKGIENKGAVIELQEQEVKLKEEIENLSLDVMACDKEIKEANEEIDKIDAEMLELRTTGVNMFDTPEIKALQKDINDLYDKKEKLKLDNENANANLRQLIYEEESKKASFQKVIDDKHYYDRQMELLDKVNESIEVNQSKLIKIEQKSDLLKIFIKTKLTLLNEHVAVVFENIKFDLIQENISGGYDTICKPHIINSDVLWKSGSKSEKIITGIAMADKIKEKLNLPNLPFLFDEGGEISNTTFAEKLKTNSQLICVKVQDNIEKPTVVKF